LAASVCLPTARFDVVIEACPLTSPADPRTAEPSMKVTVPVGVPLVDGLTVAVSVTD
jgi:hypothetical protein